MSSTPSKEPPIESVTHVKRRTIMMPRGQKTTTIRETRVSLPRLRCLEAGQTKQGRG